MESRLDSDHPDPILAEQVEYYRARAPEYDDWYLRRGRYDHGQELNDRFRAEINTVETEVRALANVDRILELAAGTGWWTRLFRETGARVTAVDSSPEVLAKNRGRNGDEKIEYVEADVLSWTPRGRYDLVFFGCWLSHVPPDQFETFWNRVGESVKPEGKVAFVDTLREGIKTVAARDHHRRENEGDITERYLNDGTPFKIYKVFYQPEELTERLQRLGWEVKVKTSGEYFLFGSGEREN